MGHKNSLGSFGCCCDAGFAVTLNICSGDKNAQGQCKSQAVKTSIPHHRSIPPLPLLSLHFLVYHVLVTLDGIDALLLQILAGTREARPFRNFNGCPQSKRRKKETSGTRRTVRLRDETEGMNRLPPSPSRREGGGGGGQGF